MIFRTVPILGLLLASQWAWAAAPNRSLAYDPGVVGVLQRLRVKGKTVVRHDTMPGGGSRTRTDYYYPAAGTLRLLATVVKGTHDSGVSFSNVHFYGRHGGPRADVVTTLSDLGDRDGTNSIAGSSLGQVVAGTMRALRTFALRSDSYMQTAERSGTPDRLRTHFGLSDGSIDRFPDHSIIIRDDQGVVKMPAPRLTRR